MTSTNTLGIRNGNQIIPYGATTKRTKEIDIAAYITGSPAFTSVSHAKAIFYADSANVWRMRFNISTAFNSTTITTVTATIANVAFKSGPNQSISAYMAGTGTINSTIKCYTGSADGTLNALFPSTASAISVTFSGDVELNAEPTTYTIAANMEGAVNASVYIPPASAGVVGLVNNAVANTAGTPILGKTDGVAVAAGYVGEVLEGVTTNSTITTSMATFTTMNITAGTWMVTASVYCAGAVSNTGFYARLDKIGVTGSVTGKESIAAACVSQQYSYCSFPAQPVVVTASTATKTIQIAVQAVGANAAGWAYISAIRIA